MGIFGEIWKTSYNISKGIVGTQAALIGAAQSKRALQKIKMVNEANRGITNYDASDIEPFVGEEGDIQNVIVSGLNHDIRNRAVVAVLANAYDQGYHSIVLHGKNQQLEKSILSMFGTGNAMVINSNRPIYDPIVGLSSSEISRMIIQTAPKGYEIASVGRYYVEGMIDFLKHKGKTPCITLCMNCPHLTLLDNISNAESKGIITADEAKKITSKIVQGSTERANVENYFSMLKEQSFQIIAKKSNLNDAMTLREAVKQFPVCVLDVISESNTLLMNLLAYEVTLLLSRGKKILLVIDGLQLSSNERLQGIIQNSGGGLPLVLSEDDMYASSGGNDNLFFSLAGKARIIVLCKHASAYSCQKWADVIGFYDKQEISTSFSQSSGYMNGYNFGNSHTSNVALKRENIIKPEEINRMESSEVYVINRNIGEIAHTIIRA